MNPEAAKERFNSLIKALEVDEVALRELLDDLHKDGVTSRYLDMPGTPPFIVLDRVKFEDAIKRRLIVLAESFITSLMG